MRSLSKHGVGFFNGLLVPPPAGAGPIGEKLRAVPVPVPVRVHVHGSTLPWYGYGYVYRSAVYVYGRSFRSGAIGSLRLPVTMDSAG